MNHGRSKQEGVAWFALLQLFAAIGFGCGPKDEWAGDSIKRVERVFYYDRNGDGKVDFEVHRYPGTSDLDGELRDDNYDGRFELKLLHGLGAGRTNKWAINQQVPEGVRIESSPAPN